jgi:hypothetical protein
MFAEWDCRIPVDAGHRKWDYPTMTTTADSKKRIVLPVARPGDVFDIQRQGEGQFVLLRLTRPEPEARLTRAQCLRAIDAAPLHPKMDWATLRELTREP